MSKCVRYMVSRRQPITLLESSTNHRKESAFVETSAAPTETKLLEDLKYIQRRSHSATPGRASLSEQMQSKVVIIKIKYQDILTAIANVTNDLQSTPCPEAAPVHCSWQGVGRSL